MSKTGSSGSHNLKSRLAGWVARSPLHSSTGIKGKESQTAADNAGDHDELDSIAESLSWAAEELARLQRELEARTTELAQSLQDQAATADALKAISRSTSDLETVLAMLVESGAKLTNCAHAAIYLRDGEMLRSRAVLGARSKKDLNQLAGDRSRDDYWARHAVEPT